MFRRRFFFCLGAVTPSFRFFACGSFVLLDARPSWIRHRASGRKLTSRPGCSDVFGAVLGPPSFRVDCLEC